MARLAFNSVLARLPLLGVTLSLIAVENTAGEAITSEQEALLRRADVGSGAPPSFRALLTLKLEGRPEARRIEVWRSQGNQTLVRFLDSDQRGKYLLYTQDELWFLAPGSRKSVKLPHSFRIQGAATLDDILGRQYSRDYVIQSVGKRDREGIPRVEFHLKPRTENAQFASILYVVDPDSARPERAEFRLRSGRLATVLEFADWSPGARLLPRRLRLKDSLKGGRTTEVNVLLLEERAVPAGLFDRRDASERTRLEVESPR